MYRKIRFYADQLCLIELLSQHPVLFSNRLSQSQLTQRSPIYKSPLVPLLAVAEEMQQRALAEAGLPENREYPSKFGSHPGNPRLNSVWNMTGACALFQFEDRTFITMERAMTQQAPKPKPDPKPVPGKPGPGGR
jgi:hypothetical protein